MKNELKKVVCVIMLFLGLMLNYSLNETLASEEPDIETYSFRETLPVKYEIWYSMSLGPERRNEQYRDYTFQNGYKSTDSLVGNIELTPLQSTFYSKAELWKVTYTFY